MKLVAQETETAAFRDWLSSVGGHVISSEITHVELMRSTRRREPQRILRAQLVLTGMRLIAIAMPVISEAARLEPANLRSLDALHLATALTLGPDLDGLVTYDDRLADAARMVGVQVLRPT